MSACRASKHHRTADRQCCNEAPRLKACVLHIVESFVISSDSRSVASHATILLAALVASQTLGSTEVDSIIASSVAPSTFAVHTVFSVFPYFA